VQALFWPTPLGEALVGGYCKMGLSNLWQPNLRRAPAALLSRRVCWRWRQAHWCSRTRAPRTRRSPCFIAAPHSMLTRVVRPRGLIERNITAVAQGRRTKEEVLAEAVQCFRADYLVAAQKQGAPRPAVPRPLGDAAASYTLRSAAKL